jgi:hypothetical protein
MNEEKDVKQREESNENSVDRVGETNIYPVSEMDQADDDAEVVTPAEINDSKESGEE